jgi:hypothetical protein
MTRPEAETLVELQAFIAEYWASVDRVADARRAAASFFTESGEMQLGSLHVRGREQLEAFFAARDAREIANRRSTRHFTVNFRVHEAAEGGVTIAALVLVHSGIGDWPLTSAPPSAVGDFTFICVRDGDGWLFETVSGNSVFVGEGAPGFAKTTS